MLFIVAAYPATGKSTALAHSVREKVQLFGPDLDPKLREAIRAEKLNEKLSAAEKIANGMWLTYRDLDELEPAEAMPEHLAFHLDLLLLLILQIRPKRLSDLQEGAIPAVFEQFFEHPLIKSYSEIAVNTLFPEFDHVRANWVARYEGVTRHTNPVLSVKNDLILNIADPEGFYRHVTEQWLRVAGERSDFNIVSSLDK
jgi:hypothetical protein